ncbi:MAG: hypothetical protein WCH20_11355 [Nitrospira sp.]
MGKRTYLTLAPELEEYAECVATELEDHGYAVKADKDELGFPRTPTLLAKRQRTTLVIELVIEVTSSGFLQRLDSWTRFGKSCGYDLRVLICVPKNYQPSLPDQEQIRAKGCGLWTVSSSDVTIVIPPHDLAIGIVLPERRSLLPRLKTLLGTAYEQFDQASWREGFDEACKVLEIEARRYLRHWMRTGRIQLMAKKGPRTLTRSQVDKLPMGELTKVFRQIVAKTRIDSQIERALAAINADRVLRTHHKHKKITESSLRRNVGRHMWTIIETLKLIP